MKEAAAEIARLSDEQIAAILDGKALSITVGEQNIDLTCENVMVDRIEKDNLKVINDGTLTVGLDTKISDELKKEEYAQNDSRNAPLKKEGYARDVVRGIQNLRKESGFEITDRITLVLGGDAELKGAFDMFKDFIANETLSVDTAWQDGLADAAGVTKIEADGLSWKVKLAKA